MSIKKPMHANSNPESITKLNRHLSKHSLMSMSDWKDMADEYVWGGVSEEEAALIEKIMQAEPSVSDIILDASLKRDDTCKMKMDDLKESYGFSEAQWDELVQKYIVGSVVDNNVRLVEVRAIYDDAFADQIHQEKLLQEVKETLGLNPKSGSISSIQSQGPVSDNSKGSEKKGL